MIMGVKKLDNLYYNQSLDKRENEAKKQQRKKAKDREKRIKETQKKRENTIQGFDFETETVIGMTNKNNQRKRQAIQKQMQQQERKKQKKRKRIKRIIQTMTILCLLAGGVTFALISPIFNIQEVQVVGNQLVQADTIVSLSGLSKNQNIFKFINLQIERKIKENPYIQEAKVKRIFPNAVQIQVEERQRNFNIEFMNKYAYINNQGYILEIANNKLDVPVIQGIKTSEENVVEGKRLETEDLEKLETVIQIVTIWKTNNIEQVINNIDITDKNEYKLYVEQEKKTIYLGDKSNMNNKILWVQAIMNDNKDLEGEIYVDGDLNDNFRPRFKQKV